jgi:hypothetical protein
MFVLAGRCGRVVDDLRKALGHALRRKPLNVVDANKARDTAEGWASL